MKRQRGRNRGSGGGGQKPTQNANRAFDSNGPEGVKVRGNPQHVFEKYQQLARDANAAGDRVLGENYLQHAEHYFRLLRAIQPNRPASEIIGRDQFASGYDIDFEDESGQAQAMAADEASEANEARGDDGDRDQNRDRNRDRGEWQARDDRPRDRAGDGARDRWQPREGRDRDRNRNRDDRPRDDRPRDERPRDDRPRDDRPRDDRPRDDRPRDDRPRAEGDERPQRFERNRDRDRDRDDRPERSDRDPLPVVQPQGDPAPEDRGPVLRDSDGEHSSVPAFLRPTRAAPAPAVEAVEEKPKARRRRAPRSFEGGEGAPATADSED